MTITCLIILNGMKNKINKTLLNMYDWENQLILTPLRIGDGAAPFIIIYSIRWQDSQN